MLDIKLYWDFFGPDAEVTALHHALHLEQYFTKANIPCNSGYTSIDSQHWCAFAEIQFADLERVKTALRPHRGERMAAR